MLPWRVTIWPYKDYKATRFESNDPFLKKIELHYTLCGAAMALHNSLQVEVLISVII